MLPAPILGPNLTEIGEHQPRGGQEEALPVNDPASIMSATGESPVGQVGRRELSVADWRHPPIGR
jgi:hypothetical protein